VVIQLSFLFQFHNSYCTSTNHFIGQHEQNLHLLLPHHLPEVSAGVLQRTLGHDVLVAHITHSKLQKRYTRVGINLTARCRNCKRISYSSAWIKGVRKRKQCALWCVQKGELKHLFKLAELRTVNSSVEQHISKCCSAWSGKIA